MRCNSRTALGTEISRFGCCRPSRRLVSNSSTCTVLIPLLGVSIDCTWRARSQAHGTVVEDMKRKPKLGQNFLVDQAARLRIADALGDVSASTVIEIGPGHGAITSILAGRCRRLIAIELDRTLAAELHF